MSSYFAKASTYLTLLITQFRSFAQSAEPEPVDYPFTASDIEQLHRICSDSSALSIDEQTRNGLLLDDYFAMLTPQVSIFGKQVLHHRLIDGLDDPARAALIDRLRLLMADPDLLNAIRSATRSLRSADTEIAALLMEETLPEIPRWAGYSWLLFVGLAASLGAVMLTPLAWLGAGYFMYQLISIQMRYTDHMAAWDRAMHSVQMLLRASSLLSTVKHPLLGEFAGASALAGKINRRLAKSRALDSLGVRAYLDWFLMANIKHYFKTIGLLGLHRDFVCACYLRCANLEADIALAQHLLDNESTCWAERSVDSAIVLDEAVHPLLERATALSISLHHKGAFISGQNGIGKSTFLRTIGLNLLVARAFGFCYASKAVAPMLPVYASMQSEDSLQSGESLYIAELQRARDMLATADRRPSSIFIIDEIFRGTNHLESVSAAAAVLDVLAATSMVIVSSHNLVLASLLEHRLAPFCVALDADGELTLAPGVLADSNGIALLAQRGFSVEIEAKAAAVSRWLGTYLAQPHGGSNVLNERPSKNLRHA